MIMVIFLHIVILIGAIIGLIVKISGEKETKRKEQEEYKKRLAKCESDNMTFRNQRSERIKRLGNYSYENHVTLSERKLFFEVYENVSIIVLGKSLREIIELNFKDIISVEIRESGRVINSTSSSAGNIKSNTGSMIGRAVVGSALAGGAGAIIGGTTGNKSTNTYCNTETHEIVNYKLSITMNDLKNPIVSIDFDNQGIDFMQSLYSVLQVIINRNKEKSVQQK